MEAITNSSLKASSVSCWRCLNTGMRIEKRDGKSFAMNCLCLKRSVGRAQLKSIPPVFNKPKLSLAPVEVRARFERCKNGVGKSHLAFALFRHAIAKRRPAVACPVRDLIADFRRVEVGVPDGEALKSPRVSSDDLKRSKGRRYFLFLDEFEKARPTEFAAEQLFNLLDAARSFDHQLVVTSNFNAAELRNHWGRINPVWGSSIMTRLEACHLIELF